MGHSTSLAKDCSAGLSVGFFYLGSANSYLHIKIYRSNPAAPVPEKGQVYRVHVMHGSLKYVTIHELEEFRESENRPTLVGIPLIIGFLTLFTKVRITDSSG